MKANWLHNLGKTVKKMLGYSYSGDLPVNDGQKRLDIDTFRGWLEDIVSTRPDEIACDELSECLDGFVEMVLDGKNAAEMMPLVQDHLKQCHCCHEEFEMLLAMLKSAS